MIRDDEVRGVRLGDLYRDQDGALWEVYALCNEPTASVRRVDSTGLVRRFGDEGQVVEESTYKTETHVIGCRNWDNKWSAGPLREAT